MPSPNRMRRRLGANPYANRAAQFVGASSQSLSIADNASLSMGAGIDCTLAGWVWFDALTANSNLITKGNAGGTNTEYEIYLTSSKLAFFATNNGTTSSQALNATVLTTGVWNFFVAQYDGTNLKMAVNNGAFNTAAIGVIFDGTNRFTLGSSDAGGAFLSGRLDSVGVWTSAHGAGGALTAAQLTALYNNGVGMAYRDLGALTANLMAWWNLDNNGNDSTPNANHLTNNNGVTFVAGKR